MFVAFSFVHGMLDATPFQPAPLLRWSYIAIGAVGLAFYLYRKLLARHFKVLHDYEVDSVRTLADGVTEIALRPLDRQMDLQSPGNG